MKKVGRRADRALAAGVALLLAAALPAAGQPGGPEVSTPAVKTPRRAAHLVGWWQHEALCAQLGIGAELRLKLAAQLENLQTSYQLAQTRLAEARRRQSAMLLDPAVSHEQLVALNRSEVAAASEKMQALNFEARLLVRGKLSREQLAKVAAEQPLFFSARWFKASAVPVLEGKVAADEE